HPQENFLRQVFRLFPVANHPEQEVDEWRAIALQQKLKRSFVTGFHIQHELDVGSDHSRHTLPNPFVFKKLQLRHGERGSHGGFNGLVTHEITTLESIE